MVWFKVDDNFHHHPKSLAAGNAALGLWARAGSWSSSNLTSGFIPRQIAHQMGTKSQIVRLLNAGLWHEVSDGYQFHEWDERQPSKSDVEADREANRKRQARYREAQRAKRDAEAEKESKPGARNGVTRNGSNGVTRGERNGVTNDPHTRPDPTIPTNYSPKSASSPTDTRAFADGVPLPPEPADDDPPRTAGALALVPDYVPAAIEPARRRTPPARLPDSVRTLLRYTLPGGIPRAVLDQIGAEVVKLTRDPNVDRADIETALRTLGGRADAGPRLLPHLVADAARARQGATTGRSRPSTTDQRVADNLAVADKYRQLDEADHTQPAIDYRKYLQ
ncbi:hypothetical protein SEA_STORMINNORM_53 [Gordonia Phage StorminNorm]|nr:hypothetical protein SEA_STORMINNORM_53 [Gordonia Phage StorminNorm]